MNENIDLTKILRNCPKGWKLWSPIFGEIEFHLIVKKARYPIILSCKKGKIWLSKGGLFDIENEGAECILFPSKDQRDWSKFTAPWYKKKKFDPKTLKVFDKILARKKYGIWYADFISLPIDGLNTVPCIMGDKDFDTIIPYNDDTKHLLCTSDKAPEYYRYWED